MVRERVKVLKSEDPHNLERYVNDWLKNFKGNVINLQLVESGEACMIYYKEPKKT